MYKFFIALFLILVFSPSMVQPDTITVVPVESDTMELTAGDTLAFRVDTLLSDTSFVHSIGPKYGKGIESEKEPWRVPSQVRQELATPGEVINVISFKKIFWTFIILLIGYFITQFVVKIMSAIAERSAKLRIGLKSTIPVIRILIWILVVFAIIKGIYNPPAETYLAMWASAAIAIGLAAQDLLKNVFGGIMLLFDRPFQVGDKIETGKYYGEVLEIGLRSTRIVTPDDSVVSVPNMELMNSSVSNANSGELNCQVVAEIFLPIDVNTQKARKIAIETAQISRYIHLEKPVVVIFLNEVKERRSYLKMRLKAYVMDIRYEFQFKSDMTEIVIRELLTQGVIRKGDLF